MGACASKPNEANGPTPTEAPPADNSVSREITETDAPTEAKEEETVEVPLVDISESKPAETESAEPLTPVAVEELASSLKELNTEALAQPNKEEEEEETDKKEEIKADETQEEET